MSIEQTILNRISYRVCLSLGAVAVSVWASLLSFQAALAQTSVSIASRPHVQSVALDGAAVEGYERAALEFEQTLLDSPQLPWLLTSQMALPQNTYMDDLVVDHNDTLTGDVVVVSGDVTIKEGGEIDGNLIVLSGDVEIDAGGRVEGDVASLSGDVEVEGKILGNLAVLSGDVELSRSGLVEGDVSVFSGELDQNDSAEIQGQLSLGPKVDFPFVDFFGEEVAEELKSEFSAELDEARENAADSRAGARDAARQEEGVIGRFFSFVFRLVGAAVVTLVIGFGAGLLMRARPDYVESVRLRLQRERVANFAVGLLFNMGLGLLTVLFTIIICLFPMALVGGGLVLAVNGIGWTAIGASVGRRLTGVHETTVQSAASVALGTLAITAPFMLLWAGGGCLRVFAILGAVAIASVGAGSVLAPWLKRLSSDGGTA